MRAITNPAVNIPISTSILHEQEYNISMILKYIKKSSTRRAISDKRNNRPMNITGRQLAGLCPAKCRFEMFIGRRQTNILKCSLV